ncbi:MAG: hypothetical protein A2939_03115 [Parcubacteria group bacterium RIFCSPLOWO2_01_FULL_48_18]|nr:MAG: hypothetical protein A2939_03115 [Parcubacteria group bacterium RIFCSPLOWO2_01_FULL_48_18]OHB23277.1 MAG: hypothetical protein A3J67_04260 [Parcubacteria group bacterium RIFCSPHIGHO2_02_FULL_48_10b]
MITILRKVFSDLGLSDKEIQAMFVLLQEGSLRVPAVAKKARLNRTTTYGILKSLTERGLVSSADRGGIIEYQSIPPSHIIPFIERKRDELQDRKDEIKEILPELKKVREKRDILPRIRFFEGIEGIKQAYEDTLENNKEKKLLDFTGTDAIFKKMDKGWIEYYVKKRTRLSIKCIAIAPDTQWSRVSQKRDGELLRTTKLLPEKYTFDTEIDIYDNNVGIFSFSEDQPIAILIEDEKIAHTLKTLFYYTESTLDQDQD